MTARRGLATLALSAVLVGCFALTFCGEGLADAVAIRIQGSSITETTVAHWVSVIAGEGSTAPVPRPPRYAACIAYLRRSAAARGSERPTRLQLKRECELDLRKYELKALYLLISYDWVSGEAAELGVRVTTKAAEQRVAALESRFPDIRTFLVGTRGTVGDMLLRVKLSLLAAKVQQRLEERATARHLTATQRQQALNRFGLRFRRRWTARTSCHPGYVVPICREYRPPKRTPTLTPPSIPLTDMTVGRQQGTTPTSAAA